MGDVKKHRNKYRTKCDSNSDTNSGQSLDTTVF